MNQKTKDMVSAALCVALGLIVPQVFHLIPFVGTVPNLGGVFLPMHIPVLLCGFLCGWKYGLAVGFVLPLLRSATLGMPPMFPTGIAMAFELAAYGFLAGFLYARSRWQCVISLYRCLIAAMIGGRIVWAVARVILSGVSGQAFTWQMFLSGAFLTAIPGIILQLVFIPAVMVALDRTGLVRFRKSGETVPAA